MQTKNANKRLSIEGQRPADPPQPSTKKVRLSIPGSEDTTGVHPADDDVARRPSTAQSEQSEPGYVIQHIDVTEEVNRRLQESRLRRLMETPSTAQKRKRDEDDDVRMESGTEAEMTPRAGREGNSDDPTPTKRMRLSGNFEQTGKRALDESDRQRAKASFKRRKYSWQSK